ncbi:TPA: hypothetical protein DCX15_05385 [bacterium]|nr:hypothetical protein [bacterium]
MEPTWSTILIEPIQAMLSQVTSKIPDVAMALLILIIGWLLAKAVKAIVTKGLKIVRFDIAAGKAGISNALVKGGVKYTPAELIGILVYWLIILVIFGAAVDAIGLEIAAEMFKKLFDYIPCVIAAIFVLVLGMFLAGFVGGVVRTATTNAGVAHSKVVGGIAQYIIIIFAIVIALNQLKIEIDIVNSVIGYLVMGICLAFGLAFGLGCKDIAGEFMKNLIDRYTKQE